MKIDTIKNIANTTYKPISFKSTAASEVAFPLNETQPTQDSFERTSKAETVQPNPVIAFLGKVHNAVQSFIDATPDPYYADHLIGLPY